MFKIKSGELKPEHGFVASRSAHQEEKVSTEPLAVLGIEFKSVAGSNVTGNKGNVFSKPNDSANFSKGAEQTYQKPNYTNRPSNPERKKHSGPSPLLRGLLEKIAKGGKESTKEKGFKIEETVAPISKQEPMSLSALKDNNNDTVKTATVLPTKEASEEKKATLKDVLSRINMNHKLEIKEEIIKPVEIKKEEPQPIQPKIEESKKEEIKVEEPKQEIKKEEKKPEPEVKTSSDSWQKRKAKREVPEDVLRKVLE